MTDDHQSEANEPELIETPADEAPEELQAKTPAKLERLQKILAAAGVASRRRAEELIAEGRVQVNGKIVTEPGTKANAGRDHIRVDGKLLQGAERLRYFVLNKPKGYVTTVKDPEGRPTVMEFFEKMKERLYPVGRLDYQSEGLLVVTNDGELANRLTRAASGVEKTYLVKVSGQPSEDDLDRLRSGVAIDRGKPGEGKVRTAPARIRQVRQGDNPWFEVILIEGRNRELRKMFEEIGHFVEKIRRVGYGPLVLDQEPGNLRELEPEELEALRKTAEGKFRTPKSKELRRQNMIDAQRLPTVKPNRAPGKKFGGKVAPSRPSSAAQFEEVPPARPALERPRPAKGSSLRPDNFKTKKPFGKPATGRESYGKDRPARPAARPGARPSADFESRPPARQGARPDWKQASSKNAGRAERPSREFSRPSTRFDKSQSRPARPTKPEFSAEKPRSFAPRSSGAGRAGTGRTGSDRPFGAKPAWNRTGSNASGRSGDSYKRPSAPRREFHDSDDAPVRPPNLHIEEIPNERFSGSGPRAERPRSGRPGPGGFKSSGSRPGTPSFKPARPRPDAPTRPPRADAGLARPFTTSSSKPRPGGARPSSKSGKSGSGPKFESTRFRTKPGWKPKPGGKAKPGGFSASDRKGKPNHTGGKVGGPKRNGNAGKFKRGN